MTTRFAKSPDFVSMLSSVAGPDYGKMGNQAQQMQGHLQRTATTADANARKSDIEAQKIIDMAPYQAAMQQPQGGGGGGFGDILGSVAGIVGGLGGGGGGASFLGSAASPGGSAGVAGIGGGGMVNPFTNSSYLSLT